MSQTVTLSIEKMNCASCVGRVDRALAAVTGVTEVSVNLATDTATVTGDASVGTLIRAANDAGYPARRAEADAAELGARLEAAGRDLQRMTLVAAVLTLPVFVLAMGSHIFPQLGEMIGRNTNHLIQGVLTTLVLAWPGRRFFADGFPALIKGAPDMNSLVALGTSAAWIYSVVVMLAPGLFPAMSQGVYFEAAAVIVTLILTGRWLEARARGRTGAAIRALVGLRPPTAQVMRDGQATEIAVEQIRTGDHVLLRPGERVPVDGVIIEGTTTADEAMISGEPLPVEKRPGDAMTGGTVNGSGSVTLETAAVGEATVLAGIIRLVQSAQGSKLPVQALVDRITLWFVPAVLAVALVTVLAWLVLGPAPVLSYALVAGVSVLIIACPCAMGLATPTSVMVAIGRAAEMGVLFRKGDALQSLAAVDVVVFDKTGTLTEGRPVLQSLSVAPTFEKDRALALIAALEARSEHPLARAILAAAQEAALDLPAASEIAAQDGMGITGMVEGHRILIGSARMMQEQGVDVSGFDSDRTTCEARGQTVFYAASDGQPLALLAVSDAIRPGAGALIAGLKKRGVRVAMVTGDSEEAASVIAAELGIDTVAARVLPAEKTETLHRLRGTPGTLAFVGDGINDAPALAAADVGIAIGTGTDVAIEAADVVLMSGNPLGVLRAIHVSEQTMRNIRQNLFWAFGYNVALIPVAAGVFFALTGWLLSPMLAAGAMALSSVFVLSNALRLRRLSGDPV
ncbi:heavy metal translocating P-type ATPase [uncultured Roseobacter sp.]|uniref:heavy metal translocating P-type ATPase n=1 Tax=uncultured Roseobacter sp. TaxID=114847 RepID=UPI0026320C7B|nr:heavy metal translocating P-type ATPase [uncultured Roseobacter sp.]